jgi:hypothetical protein
MKIIVQRQKPFLKLPKIKEEKKSEVVKHTGAFQPGFHKTY